jgi:predicted aspartyl protease
MEGMNRKRRSSSAALVKAVLLCVSLCLQTTLSAAPGESAVVTNGPDIEVKEFRLDELEARLRTIGPGPEHDYFAGVLANRAGRIAESIGLLNGALPNIRVSRPDRAAVALEALADDYSKSFQYADAARAYDDLLTHYASQLSRIQLQGTKDDSGVVHLLLRAPAQTITWDGSTRLATERNALGTINTELTVNGVGEQWLLDTGANLSVVSRSFAQRLGLKLLPGVGQTMAGVTGIENPLHVAILPTLQMGSATLHNVVVMVLDDANLNVGLGKGTYQINAVIGYPVFRALGTVTFLHGGGFEAGDKTRRSTAGARMYMKLLTPVIECGVEGKNLPFSFDTGASGTNLSLRYYDRFRGEARTWVKGENESYGAGGLVKRTIYLQPQLNLGIGDETVTLNRVPIFLSSMGSDIDDLYGNLGQDVVAKFDSFTLDFSTMTFHLGEPLSPHPGP